MPRNQTSQQKAHQKDEDDLLGIKRLKRFDECTSTEELYAITEAAIKYDPGGSNSWFSKAKRCAIRLRKQNPKFTSVPQTGDLKDILEWCKDNKKQVKLTEESIIAEHQLMQLIKGDRSQTRDRRSGFLGMPKGRYDPTGDSYWWRQPRPAAGGKAETKKSAPEAKHSVDFRSVHWFGTDYNFTPNQAAAVKILWEAWENKTPDVGADTLAVEIGSDSRRARDIFKGHPAFGSMIRQGKTKGTYRLVEPDK